MTMPLRRGPHAALEEAANALIKESLVGVTKHSAKSDILTPWKEAERYRREVYVASGVPDASTRRGIFHRVTNPTKPELNCLTGETKVYTRDSGLLRIEDLVDTTQEVLTSTGWSKGEFRSYGLGEVQRLVVSRSGVEKTLWATPNHRWFVHPAAAWQQLTEVRTDALEVGLPLATFDSIPYPEPWVVLSVEPVSAEREVFCAVVAGAENFLLADGLLTGNSRDGVARPRRSMSQGLTNHVTHDTAEQD